MGAPRSLKPSREEYMARIFFTFTGSARRYARGLIASVATEDVDALIADARVRPRLIELARRSLRCDFSRFAGTSRRGSNATHTAAARSWGLDRPGTFSRENAESLWLEYVDDTAKLAATQSRRAGAEGTQNNRGDIRHAKKELRALAQVIGRGE